MTMDEPRLRHVDCQTGVSLHRMAYWEWGDADNRRVLVCVHGLTRQGRDFDALARALSSTWRVVCPDVAGRGASDWLAEPSHYAVPTYVSHMVTLLARLDVEQVDWVGTSMGGLIGLGLASLVARDGRSLVRRLVLNDVGPAIEPEAVSRIATYLGQRMQFESLAEGYDYLRSISAGFGIHDDATWERLSRPLFKPDAEHPGSWRLHYDPRIAAPIRAMTPAMAQAGEAMLWALYDRLRCPTLLLRGADSDLLTSATAQAMMQRGPKARLHEVPDTGHAPMLVDDETIHMVRSFLDGSLDRS